MTRKDFLKGLKVLIVDDEPDVLETLEDLLDECDLERADSFEAARRLMDTRRFDVAVLDIMGVDGYRLLQIARQKHITAVMLTAHALSPESIVRSYKEGAAYYIPKEKMSDIPVFLQDVLEARQKGRSTWRRWFSRMGGYCEKRFGPDWQEGDKIFWEKFPFY